MGTCRCDEMVDVADSKSAASDGVPVRVRSPAPITKAPLPGCLCYWSGKADANPSECKCPVDTRCHRLKSRWLPYTPAGNGCGNRVRSPAPKQYNPNQLFRVGNGFGLFVYFTRYEYTYFGNGWQIRPESKPRGPREKKRSK